MTDLISEVVAAPPTTRRSRTPLQRVAWWMAAAWMGLIIFLAIFGPWLGLQDPNRQGECTTKQPRPQRDESGHEVIGPDGKVVMIAQAGCSPQEVADDAREAKPSPRHPLGNDYIGRDIWSRVVAGARTTVVIAFGAVLTALVIGGIIGAVTAYVGGGLDAVVTSLLSGLLAMPAIVMAIALVAAFDRSMTTVWAALSIVAIPAVALLSRGQALSLVQREYVVASKMLGAKHPRVMWREVIPNLLPFAFVFIGIGVAAAIAAEGGLAVLGLGVPYPAVSWGAMIADGRASLRTAPHIALIPSTVMFLTIWATTYLTDRARTYLDVRESQL